MRLVMAVVAALTLSSFGSNARAASSITLDDLVHMNQSELDILYANADAGPIPDGASEGRAMFFPGSILAVPSTMLASFIWQGKVFNRDDGVLMNRVFGFEAISAEIYYGASNFDGRRSVIVDYHNSLLLVRPIRDEVRLIAPNLYLGRAYANTLVGPVLFVNFALEFPAE